MHYAKTKLEFTNQKIENIMKHLLIILLVMPTFLLGQVWENTYGYGTGYSVEQTTDEGYIVIGSGLDYVNCIYMIKTDQQGDTLWTKYHHLNTRELFCSGLQTADDGYIITGLTDHIDYWYNDVFLLKTDSNGDTLWSKVYGGSNDDIGVSVQQTADGGYIITGWSDSFSSSHQVYLIKTDSEGEMMWSKTYGDDDEYTGRSVIQTNDGGYFITGYGYTYPPGGAAWVYLTKTDSIGNVLWTTTLHDVHEDFGHSGKQTNDGGYIITGGTDRLNNISDLLLMKTSANGEIDWVKTYGENNTFETGYCVQQTFDGGFIITGQKETNNNAVDVYLIRTDNYGDTLWTRTYGGTSMDRGYSVQQTTDGGYVITGVKDYYIYLIKTDSNGITVSITEIPISNPNRKLVRMFDLSGKEIFKPKKNIPYIEIYDDGTTQKKIILK